MAEQYQSEYYEVSFVEEHVLLVCINRPKKINAFIEPMWLDLRRIFTAVSRDPLVRSVVLAGNGRGFTAGLDIAASALSKSDPNAGADAAGRALGLREHILEFQDCITSIETCGKPVIAAMHGIAYGLGVDLSSACDIRYASTSTRFSIKEVDVGLAADIGTLQRFPRLVGNDSVVRELAFTAREFGADEARDLGFLGKVVQGGREEVVAAALETAKLIAAKSPFAVHSTKHLLLHARDHSVPEGLTYTATWNAFGLQSNDLKAAMGAFVTKSAPKFGNLGAGGKSKL